MKRADRIVKKKLVRMLRVIRKDRRKTQGFHDYCSLLALGINPMGVFQTSYLRALAEFGRPQ